MGDQDDSAGVGAQGIEDLLARLRVKVVGRLIEQQHIRPGADQGGQGETGLLTAGQRAGRLVELLAGEHERTQQAAQVLFIGVRAGADRVLPDGGVRVDGVVLLGEVADLETVAGDDAALAVGALHTGQQLEQCGLTGTVVAEDDHA